MSAWSVHRVLVGDGFVREAHPDHVGGDDGEPLDQSRPDQRPVEGVERITVNQQQHGRFPERPAVDPVEDVETQVVEVLACGLPSLEFGVHGRSLERHADPIPSATVPTPRWAQRKRSVELVTDGLAHRTAQRGDPAGDLAGDVLVGQADLGEHLAARRVVLELLGQRRRRGRARRSRRDATPPTPPTRRRRARRCPRR